MPRYRIQIIETVTMEYKPIVIEADDEEHAEELAEEWRVEGWAGEASFVAVDDVDFDPAEVGDDEPLTEKDTTE